jgi:hypothetical protein
MIDRKEERGFVFTDILNLPYSRRAQYAEDVRDRQNLGAISEDHVWYHYL